MPIGQFSFINCQRQRLLAVDVATGPKGGNGDRHVPVIRRADRDEVDVLLLKQLAVVFVHGQFVVELIVEHIRVISIYFTDSYWPRVFRRIARDLAATCEAARPAHTDRRKRQLAVEVFGNCAAIYPYEWGSGTGSSHTLKECTTREGRVFHLMDSGLTKGVVGTV